MPDLRQATSKADDFALQSFPDPELRGARRRGLPREGFLGRSDFDQRRFPAAFELRGDKTIVWIDPIELPLSQRSSVSFSLELALGARPQRRAHLGLSATSLRQGIKLSWRQRGQECVDDDGVDGRRRDMLAGRQSFGRAQMIADMCAATLVTDIHLMSATRAPGDAMQQEIAVARCASGLGAHVFSPVVLKGGSDFFIGRHHWDGLTLFLEDGHVEMDTNLVENQIRPLTLTRKNSLFAGHDEGGRSWSRLASLIATCKLNSVEPYAWMKTTLEAIANGHPQSRIDELMPWAFRSPPPAPTT